MRSCCTLIAVFSVLASPLAAQEAAPLPQPEFRGQIVVPSALSLNGVTFGGISDLSYDAGEDRYFAISDDRVEHGPARFYELRLTAGEAAVELDILATHELTQADGSAFGVKGADPEGIAFDGERIFWSSERDADGKPGIFVAGLDGSGRGEIALPAYYLPDEARVTGIYNNQGFEGLTLSADGSKLIAGIENGLMQDGSKATLQAGSPSRLLVIDTRTLEAVSEYLYPTEAIYTAATAEPAWNDNGLSALAALPDGRLVAVERSFANGVGNLIRFYVVDLGGAQDILGLDKIDPAEINPVKKTFWFQIDEGDFGLNIDNIESIAFGPEIDGDRSFVIASDDNFNPATQFTQFAVFTIPAK